MDIANNDKKFTYGTIEDVNRNKLDLENTLIKCEAKIKNISSIDLKTVEEVVKVKKVKNDDEPDKNIMIVEAKSNNFLPVISAFGLMGSSSFLLSYLYLKQR